MNGSDTDRLWKTLDDLTTGQREIMRLIEQVRLEAAGREVRVQHNSAELGVIRSEVNDLQRGGKTAGAAGAAGGGVVVALIEAIRLWWMSRGG